MTIHLVLFGYITFLGMLVYSRKPYTLKKNRRFIKLSFIAIWLIYSLRSYQVGWDTVNYIRTLNWIRNNHSIARVRYETLFKLLMYACAVVSDNYTFFLSVTSFIMVFGIGYFLFHNLKEGESAFLPVILYLSICLYFNSINLTRQFIAISLTSNIYSVLNKAVRTRRDYLLSILLLVGAVLFHRSAVICAFIIIILLIPKINRGHIILILLGGVVLSVVTDQALQIFYRLFPQYQIYELTAKTEGVGMGGQYTIILLFKIFLLFMCILLYRRSEFNQELYRLAAFVALSAVFVVLRTRVQITLRFSYYFEVFTLLLTPKLLNKMANPRLRLIIKFLIYAMAVVLFVAALTSSHGHRGAVPYTFAWQ